MSNRRLVTVYRVMALSLANVQGFLMLTKPEGFNPLILMLGLAISFSVLASAATDRRPGDTRRD